MGQALCRVHGTEERAWTESQISVLCIQLQCAFPGSREALVLGLVPQRTAPGGDGWEGGEEEAGGDGAGEGRQRDGHSPCQALIPSTVE